MSTEELDLTKITAAELLEALAAEEAAGGTPTDEPVKTASEIASGLTDEDLANISAEDLMGLLEGVEQEEAEQVKVAALQSGEFDGFALGGQVFGTAAGEAIAAALGQTLPKLAYEDEEIDLSQVSAAELLEALGELEAEEPVKTAGARMDAMRAWAQKARASAGDRARKVGGSVGPAYKAEQLRKAVGNYRVATGPANKAERMKAIRSGLAGAGKAGLAYGVPAAGGAAAVAAYMKRRNKK